MALLTAGYWPTTYWAEDYWADDYWSDYGAVVHGLAAIARRYTIPEEDRTLKILFDDRTVLIPNDNRTLKIQPGKEMTVPRKEKVADADVKLDYTFDWVDWLPSGDTISSSSITVGTGLTEETETNDTTSATVWVSGGTAKTTVRITNAIVTANGRKDKRSVDIACVEAR